VGVRTTASENVVALVCSTSGLAFGPVFDSEGEADDFLDWYNAKDDSVDLRKLTDEQIGVFVAQHKAEVEAAEAAEQQKQPARGNAKAKA